MSLFDELKGRAGALKDKAAGLVGENSDTIKGAVGNVGGYIDTKTGGKYSKQVDGLQAKASGFVDSFGSTGGQAPSDGNTSSN
ncbi:Rv0909 family putative TA system antitoxin [Arthrobacter sp.]|uniref:antitoxin n=1 Tax=Arthrobacter sp. TaxID=1667 RepID=UPI003390F35E